MRHATVALSIVAAFAFLASCGSSGGAGGGGGGGSGRGDCQSACDNLLDLCEDRVKDPKEWKSGCYDDCASGNFDSANAQCVKNAGSCGDAIACSRKGGGGGGGDCNVGSPETCRKIFQCKREVSGECEDACTENASSDVRQKYQAVTQCFLINCPDGGEACLQEKCGREYQACLGD